MGITNLSPRVSACRSGRQHSGQRRCQRLARKDLWSQVGSRAGKVLGPAGQRLRRLTPREITVVWGSTLGCGGRLPQQWSGACLSHTLESGGLHPSGTLKGLGTPAGKWGISPGAYLWVVPLCRHGCSGHVCRCLRCLLARCVCSDLGR